MRATVHPLVPHSARAPAACADDADPGSRGRRRVRHDGPGDPPGRALWRWAASRERAASVVGVPAGLGAPPAAARGRALARGARAAAVPGAVVPGATGGGGAVRNAVGGAVPGTGAGRAVASGAAAPIEVGIGVNGN